MSDKVCLFTRVDSGNPIKNSLSSLVLQKYEDKNVCITNVDELTLGKFKTKEIFFSNFKFDIWKSKFNYTDIFMVKFKSQFSEHEQNNLIIEYWKNTNGYYIFTNEIFHLDETFATHAIETMKKYTPHIGLVYGDIVTQGIKQYLPPFDRAHMMTDYGPYAVPAEVIFQIKFTENNIVDRITQKYLGYHEPLLVSRIR